MASPGICGMVIVVEIVDLKPLSWVVERLIDGVVRLGWTSSRESVELLVQRAGESAVLC